MADRKPKDGVAHTSTASDGYYDLAVIGAGSAGFSAAITAAEQGAQVALIGYGTIGGTCVNVGCVPSKAMIRAAEAVHHARSADRFAGIRADARIENWGALISQKDQLVDDLRRAKYIDVLPSYNNIAYIEGAARLTSNGIAVGDRRIGASKTVITTGTSPVAPAIPGIGSISYLTSTDALQLTELPKSILVIGGGYIGCELAQMFRRAGVEVTIVCRSRLLPDTEPEISAALSGYLADEGITVLDGLTYHGIRQEEREIELRAHDGKNECTVRAEQVLVTTGRRPNSDNMGLTEQGVHRLASGAIKVDDRMRTSRPGVYAAGDVTGTDQFVYMAAYGAKLAARNALNGDSLIYDNTAMPWVVFTDPQVAGVGLSESAALARGLPVKTSVIGLEHVPRALAARDTRGLIKLIADKNSDKLLGAQILAPEGADSIQTAVLAIKHGLTVTDLADTLFPYLTTVESLKLAAQTFDKDVSKLSCCAG